MYTLSQRVRDKPIVVENSGRTSNSTPRTAILNTFQNLEDACVALAKKQDSRKNTGEFFIEFRIDRLPANRSAQALPVKGHRKLQADELQHLRRENTRLRQEREILEKVTALLVTQSDFIRR
jgi:hypothetical protein